MTQETIDKINAESEEQQSKAHARSGGMEYGNMLHYIRGIGEGYAKGATEWAGKAEDVAEAMEKLNAAIDKAWNECNTKSIPDKYKKEIASAQAQCGAALAKYKEVGNG